MMHPFSHHYRNLLRDVTGYGVREVNVRTNEAIYVIEGGDSFKIDLGDGVLPTCGLKKTKPHIAAAELAWCLMGHDHINWLRKHTKVWDDFADKTACWLCEGTGTFIPDHGKTLCDRCNGTGKSMDLSAAYGHRWRHMYGIGRDQIQLAIDALKQNPTDRRIWISSWDSTVDGLGAKGQKTVPCPVGFTFSITESKLSSTFVIRSSDLFMGLPYDVMRHAYLMAAMASSIGVRLGIMQVSIAHPHLYERHLCAVKDMLKHSATLPYMKLPRNSVDGITANPDEFVEISRAQSAGFSWPLEFKGEVVR